MISGEYYLCFMAYNKLKPNILGKDLEKFIRVTQRAEARSKVDGPWWIWHGARPGHLQAARYMMQVQIVVRKSKVCCAVLKIICIVICSVIALAEV